MVVIIYHWGTLPTHPIRSHSATAQGVKHSIQTDIHTSMTKNSVQNKRECACNRSTTVSGVFPIPLGPTYTDVDGMLV